MTDFTFEWNGDVETRIDITPGSVPGDKGDKGDVGPTGPGAVVIESDLTEPPLGTAPNTLVFRKRPSP